MMIHRLLIAGMLLGCAGPDGAVDNGPAGDPSPDPYRLSWVLEGPASELAEVRVMLDDLLVKPVEFQEDYSPAMLRFGASVCALSAAAVADEQHMISVYRDDALVVRQALTPSDCVAASEERQAYNLVDVGGTSTLRLHSRGCLAGETIATAFYSYAGD